MLANDGSYVDGSWILTIHIDTLGYERKLRVQGDWSIGKVIANLIEGLPEPPVVNQSIDLAESMTRRQLGWANYKLWCPGKKKWLIHYSSSLHQAGLHADEILNFKPSYGPLRIKMPDLQSRDFTGISYTEPVFRVVSHVCRQLGIRHPEELSLMVPLESRMLKKVRHTSSAASRQDNTLPYIAKKYATLRSQRSSDDDILNRPARPMSYCNGMSQSEENKTDSNKADEALCVPRFGPPSLRHSMNGQSTKTNLMYMNRYNDACIHECMGKTDPLLSNTPTFDTNDVINGNCGVVRPHSFLQKCRLNSYWLDSAKSLMEQSIDPYFSINFDNDKKNEVKVEAPVLCLRFKYGNYYDLNTKFDGVRINQLYQQAKWSVISEMLDCSDEEAIVLAALQLQDSSEASTVLPDSFAATSPYLTSSLVMQ